MKTRFDCKHLMLLALPAVALGLTGCACTPGKDNHKSPTALDLKVVPNETLKSVSARVDVIGVKGVDLAIWQSYPVEKYFSPDDRQRADAAKKTFDFPAGNQAAQTIKKSDEIWKKEWNKPGVEYLLILADLPGHWDAGKPGRSDPRRLLVPLCKCFWNDKTTEIEVEIKPSSLSLNTAYRPLWEAQLPPSW